MWRKTLYFLTALVLFLMVTAVASADSSPTTNPVRMTGIATVGGSQRQPTILLKADAAEGSGWHLEVTLTAASAQGRRDSAGTGLSGTYTLSQDPNLAVSGFAAGQISRNGSGSLELDDRTGTPVYQASFSLNDSGQIQVGLNRLAPTDPTIGNSASTQVQTQTQSMSADHTYWYLARALGFSAFLALFVNICLGLLLSARSTEPLLARWRAIDRHQFTGFLAIGLTLLHMLVLLGDANVGFSIGQLLIPFAASFRPFWTAVGILGFYGLLLVGLSSYVRRLVWRRVWRALHLSTYILFVLVVAHSVFAGTDSGQPWATLLYWWTGGLVAGLTVFRLGNGGVRRTMAAT